MPFLDKIKAHPWATAGVVFVAGVVIILFVRRGGSSGDAITSAGPTSAVASGSDMALAQLQYSARAGEVAAGVQVAGIQAATAEKLATINSTTAQLNINKQAEVASQQIAASQSVANMRSTLDARVAEASLNRDTTIASISSNRDSALATINSNILSTLSAAQTHQTEVAANLEDTRIRYDAATQNNIAWLNYNTMASMLGVIAQRG